MAYVDLTGHKFGPLRVVGRTKTYGSPKDKAAKWLCVCDCGGQTIRSSVQLTRKVKPPTACCRTCPMHGKNKHGAINTKEYRAWNDMNQRCTNPKNARFKDYGGRGISVCAEWRASFTEFLSHVGLAPIGWSLDRIDNDRGYEPGNVRWVPNGEQQHNRRRTIYVEHDGERMPLAVLAKRLNVKKNTLYSRLRRGCENITEAQPLGPKLKKVKENN